MIDFKGIAQTKVSISILALVAILAVGYIVLQGHYAAKEKIALAEQQEKALAALKADYAGQKKQFEKTIADATSKQEELERIIAARNTLAAAKTKEVTAPDRPTEMVQADLTNYMHFTPQIQGASLLFTKPESQEVVALKIDDEKCSSDLADKARQLELEKSKGAAYEAQVNELANIVRESDKTIAAYKTAARGTWKGRAFTALKIGAVAVSAYYIGRGTK